MKIFPRNLALLIIAATLSGCFFSEKQLSNEFNSAQPLPNLFSASKFELKNKQWTKHEDEFLIRRNQLEFFYRVSEKGNKDFQEKPVALIRLNGPYYALETPGGALGQEKGKFQYAFLEFKRDRALQWNFDEAFMKLISKNPSLRRNLGVSCPKESICKVDSVADLRNILAYILNQRLRATTFYKFES